MRKIRWPKQEPLYADYYASVAADEWIRSPRGIGWIRERNGITEWCFTPDGIR